MKIKKIVIILICLIISLMLLIYLDYINIISRLRLSVSLWTGFATGIFPIALTIYLWKVEEKERIIQIKEESDLQKKLIIRGTYIEYFEELLNQLNDYIIFLECFMLNDKDLTGKKQKNDIKVNNIFGYILLNSNSHIWNIDYKYYALKCIDIDIFKYEYNNEKINLRAFLPYIQLSNCFTSIYKREKDVFGINGYSRVSIDGNEQKEMIKELLKKKEIIEETHKLLVYLKLDIEKRLKFD